MPKFEFFNKVCLFELSLSIFVCSIKTYRNWDTIYETTLKHKKNFKTVVHQ